MLQSIRSRLVALVAAVALPLFGVLVWVLWAEITRVHTSARDLALRIARSVASDAHTSNERARSLLAEMSQRPKIRRADPRDCDSLFPVVDFFPQYLNLLLYDTSGNVLCSATPAPADAPFSVAAEPFIAAQLRNGHARNLETLVLPIRGKWIAVVFQPVTNGGVTSGVLALEQYLDLDVDAFPTGTVVTIIDRQGRIVARSPDGARWIGHDARATDLGRLALRNREGRVEAQGVDGVLRQYGFTHLEGSPWIVYAGIPAGVARAAVRSLIERGILAGLIIFAVVLLLAVRIARTIERPLDILTRTARHVAEEGYGGHVPMDGPREIATVGQAFNRMMERRSEVEKALLDSRLELEALSKKLLDVQEDERTRIAREIHDELGQLLTALNMDVGGLVKSAEPLTVQQTMMAKRIRNVLAEMISSVQRISAELRPPSLDDFGLAAAIESEVHTFEERTGIECDLSFPEDTPSLGPDIDSAIYRIVQEAMTNVARHSDASRMEIRLRQRLDELLIEVRDDGHGISAVEARDRSSLGIVGMRERARSIGASLEVEGIEGHGTIVSIRIPLPQEALSREA